MLHTSGNNQKIIKDHLSSLLPSLMMLHEHNTIVPTISCKSENGLLFNSHLDFCGFLEFESSIKPKIIPRDKHRLELFRSLYGVNLVLLNSEIFLVNNCTKTELFELYQENM